MPASHQITADIFTGADQIASCSRLYRGNLDCRDFTEFEQPGQVQGILRVGFDPITRGALELRRGRDNGIDAGREEEPGQAETDRTRLVNDLDRRRQRDDSGENLIPVRRQTVPENFPAQAIQRAGYDTPGMDIQSNACTLEHSWNLQTSNVALLVRQVWQATHVLL